MSSFFIYPMSIASSNHNTVMKEMTSELESITVQRAGLDQMIKLLEEELKSLAREQDHVKSNIDEFSNTMFEFTYIAGLPNLNFKFHKQKKTTEKSYIQSYFYSRKNLFSFIFVISELADRCFTKYYGCCLQNF